MLSSQIIREKFERLLHAKSHKRDLQHRNRLQNHFTYGPCVPCTASCSLKFPFRRVRVCGYFNYFGNKGLQSSAITSTLCFLPGSGSQQGGDDLITCKSLSTWNEFEIRKHYFVKLCVRTNHKNTLTNRPLGLSSVIYPGKTAKSLLSCYCLLLSKMSESATPITSIASNGNVSPDRSTQPSSPLEPLSPSERKDSNLQTEGDGDEKTGDADDDLEGMDIKTKALMNLLKTSSVGLTLPILHTRFENVC